ncbi:hypothetical protein OG840_22525 [Streptomyces sp. NBC_01764]|uniref:winged helix domain-containing protein n=1 Tax=Streptomyces sp. NBC_01764 TaxID=2975935 RepID=UPI00224D7033|nr:winged helix domain-containing protein [Streptomyces sp. NBC_01764]MCX4404390.1 hypothetical protein [Streptomyces sp. NBC_01764]
MVPSLPYISAVPVDGGLQVRLTTARAVLDVGGDAVTLSAGSVYEFAREAGAVLRLLVDGRTVDLAALADTAGLALEDVVGLVQELVAGQATRPPPGTASPPATCAGRPAASPPSSGAAGWTCSCSTPPSGPTPVTATACTR